MNEKSCAIASKKNIKPKKTLTLDEILFGYCHGYFPMPNEKDEILWYQPDPRAIIEFSDFHVSRSLRKIINQKKFDISYNKDFPAVIRACADRDDTWINDEIIKRYSELHQIGFAHSVEVWEGNSLAGGLYGVHIGGCFFAESKFHRVSNASKVALYYLVQRLEERGFGLLEIQFLTQHLETLGAVAIDAAEYEEKLRLNLNKPCKFN